MGCLEGEQGSPGMGMELCTEALTVDLKDRRISHPEKDLLCRGKSQQRRKTPGQAGARRGASGGLPHSGRAWGSPALRPRRHCSEGGGATTVRGPRKLQPSTPPAQGPRILTEARPPTPELGVLPSVVTALWACAWQGGTQAPPAPSRAVSPGAPSPASAYCFSAELTGSSLGSQN